jgi:hypothetical protein
VADLSSFIQALTPQANTIYNPQISSTQQDYGTQLSNLANTYNTTLAQKQQALTAIPGQYQPQREAAYLANAKANSALPALMANTGYASNSGLAYDTTQGNNATWQKSVDTANTAQNTATQSANNDINNLGTTYSNNKGTLATDEAKALATIQSNEADWLNTNATSALNTANSAAAKAASSTTKALTPSSLNTYINGLAKLYTVSNYITPAMAKLYGVTRSVDPTTGAETGRINEVVDPIGLWNEIDSQNISPADKAAIVNKLSGQIGSKNVLSPKTRGLTDLVTALNEYQQGYSLT